MSQPEYHNKPAKIKSRTYVSSVYRAITGNNYIPECNNYWTVCNYQPDTEGSEINQLVNDGLIDRKQYVGVDNDRNVIEFNRSLHPTATWFYGDFTTVARANYKRFKKAKLVYFDGIQLVANPRAHVYVAQLMDICPKDCVVCVNLMTSNPYSGDVFSPEEFTLGIQKNLLNEAEWNYLPYVYAYKCSRADMAIFTFYK